MERSPPSAEPEAAGGPQPRRADARKRRVYQGDRSTLPVARPFAPPPLGSPYYQPMPDQAPFSLPQPGPFTVLPPRPPHRPIRRRDREVAIMALVVVLGLTTGWVFFRSLGKKNAGPRQGPAVVADAGSAATHKDDGKAVVQPGDNRPPAPPAKTPPPPPAVNNTAVSFEKHVLPIFEAKCLRCHGAGKKNGGLDMRTLAAMKKGGESGPALVPGSPRKSPIWETIAANRMPPGKDKLTAAERKAVQDWIASGAQSAAR